MNTITNSFSSYSPLDFFLKQIRLLLIHAGPSKAPLACSLASTSLKAKNIREYEAISYCWGDLLDQEDIKLDGQIFTITKSCGAALRAIRRKNKTRVVWIDAICINQHDGTERELQVSIMKEIYQAATRTLIFLGEDDGTFEPASKLMVALVRQMMDRTHGWGHLNGQVIWDSLKDPDFSALDNTDIRSHGIPHYDDPAWYCLEKLLCRPWFSRMWVLQEVFCSRESIALCGAQELDWKVVKFAMGWITHRSYDTRAQRSGFTQAKNWAMVTWFGDQSTLQGLLRMTITFQATDPRDKIFGLLGLATDCQTAIPSEVQPNYNKTTASVYSDATKYMIQSSQSLAILSQIGWLNPYNTTSEKAHEPFPSWVPRWDLAVPRGPRHDFGAGPLKRVEKPYSASGCSDMPLNARIGEPDMLFLQGLRIDKIKSLSTMITARALINTRLVSLLWDEYASQLKTCWSGESLLKAFSLTMVADATMHRNIASADPQHDFDFAAYISARGGALRRLSGKEQRLLEANAPKGDDVRYIAASTSAAHGRSFCTTEAGWMGLCPPTAKEGDLICLLFGGKLLYVIRREREHSTYVGECYIHERMDGSAYDYQIQTHAPAEMFCLR